MTTRPIRDVKEIIGLLEDGKLAPALTDELRSALKGLQELSGDSRKVTGEVTLKLKLTVTNGNEVEFSADVASKLPKAPRRRSFFWLTRDGELSVSHPQQEAMDFGRSTERRAQAAE